ncbi:MAG: tetratricopeptide repeat protein [Bacteroidota bacterium]
MSKLPGFRILWIGLLMGHIMTCTVMAEERISPSQTIDSLLQLVPKAAITERSQLIEEALSLAQNLQNLAGEVKAHLAYLHHTSVSPSAEAAYESLKESYSQYQQYPSKLAALHNELGDFYFYLKEGNHSIRHYQLAIDHARVQRDSQILYLGLTGITSVTNIYRTVPEALPYLREAAQVAFRLQDVDFQIEALNQLATIYMATGEVDSALLYFEKLVDFKREREMLLELSTDLQQFARMLVLQGGYEKAQPYLFEALDITEKMEAPLLRTGLLTDIGSSFLQQGLWDKSIEYAQSALALAQKLDLKQLAAVNCFHLGQAYQEIGENTQALKAYNNSLDIYQTEIPDPAEIAKIKLQLGSLEADNQNDKLALQYLEEALEFKTDKSDKLGMLDVKLTIAPIHIRQSRWRRALGELKETENLAIQLKSKSGLARTYELMAEAYAGRGNYEKAFDYQQLYVSYHDSIFNEQNTTIIHELETRYQAAQKDQQNAELNAEIAQNQLVLEQNRITILEKNRQSYILIGSIGALVFLIIFLVYRYVNKQQLLKQSMITLQKEHEAQNLRSVITGEEQERKRIARDLHDGIGPLLASIKMLFQAVQNEKPEIKQVEHYQKANQLLDQASQEVREISHNMMPGTLEHLGLQDAMRDLCTLFRHSYQIEVDFMTHGEDEGLDHPTKVTVYRITQELLRNIAKHAEAEEVIVQLIIEDNMLQLTVEDDGKGFELDKESKLKGIGLQSIQSRTVYLKGNLDIHTQVGKGTAIYVEIPLEASHTTS